MERNFCMKKFLAVLMSLMMAFSAILPSLAAEQDGRTLLTYQAELPETFTKNVIKIDPRNHTGDNPKLKANVHYDLPTWGNVLALVPQTEGGKVIPQPFDVKFTIKEKDTYHFAFYIYETADAKAGTPRKIDLCLDGGDTYRIVEEAVKPGSYLLYDGLSAELAPGEHTITFTTCTPNGFQACVSDILIAGQSVTPPADTANVTEEEKIDTTVKGEHKTSKGDIVKSLVGTASMPSVFTYATKLDLTAEMTAQKGSAKNKDLVEGTAGDYYIDTAFQNAACVISRREGNKTTAWPEFAIEFEVDEAGTYHFCIGAYVRGDDAWAEGKTWQHASSVRIDDGEVFSVNEDDLTNLGKNTVNYYLGLSAELSAGKHTLYLIADKHIGLNAYFKTLHYYREGAEPTAPTTPDTPDTPSTPAVDPNAGKMPEGALTYLPEMPESMAGGDIVTLDPRDFADDNPNLVKGTDYNMLYMSEGGWGDVLCLIPKSAQQPVTYNIKFTVEDAGKYEFSVGIWTSPDAKAGTPRKIDVFLDGGEKHRITETAEVAVNNVANFYGITETLAAGEHTFSFQTCTQNGLQCYLNTLTYSITESNDPYDPAIEATWGDTNIPVETEPVETDPVEDEPIETDPVETDPVETDPIESDPIESDPAETDAPGTSAPENDETSAPDTPSAPQTPTQTPEEGSAPWGIIAAVVGVIAVVLVGVIAVLKKKKK